MENSPNVSNAIVTCQAVSRVYGSEGGRTLALDNVSLDVDAGASVAIMGPSGSGKSTLLHLVGAMDRATSGKVVVAGRDLGSLHDREASQFRRETLGFVFQFFNLVPTLSALDNVALPARLAGVGLREARSNALELLQQVELHDRAGDSPDRLSGGQQQRVALARALVNRPKLLLADEPTGALDTRSGEQVLELLAGMVRERGTTLIMATHSQDALRYVSRVVQFADGRIVRDTGPNQHSG